MEEKIEKETESKGELMPLKCQIRVVKGQNDNLVETNYQLVKFFNNKESDYRLVNNDNQPLARVEIESRQDNQGNWNRGLVIPLRLIDKSFEENKTTWVPYAIKIPHAGGWVHKYQTLPDKKSEKTVVLPSGGKARVTVRVKKITQRTGRFIKK